jgi:hypothetical protein
MSTYGASWTIDQTGKPAGPGKTARDDLDLNAEVTGADHSDGTSWQWTLYSKPIGSVAELVVSLDGKSFTITPDVADTYIVDLVVDGGAKPEDNARIVFGVRRPVPKFDVDDSTSLRIPGFGERREFNTEPAITPVYNSNRYGWLRELGGEILRKVTKYGFGVKVDDQGDWVDSYWFKFTGNLELTFDDYGAVEINSSGAPAAASFWTSKAEAGLPGSYTLGLLTTGLLKHVVASGISTPLTAEPDVDYTTPTGLDAAIADAFDEPMIIDFSSANHTHENVVGGGQLTGSIFANPLSVPHGGTGVAAAVRYSVLCGGIGTEAAFQFLPSIGTAGQILVSNGPDAYPTWQTGGAPTEHNHTQPSLGGQITDAALSAAVGIAKGGTGRTTNTVHAPLCGGATTTGALAQATTGMATVGYVLTSNGADALPTWQASSFTPSYPFTTAQGGTGNTTLTPYALLCAGALSTAAISPMASLGTTGQVLTSNGPGAYPTWQAGGGGGGVLGSGASPRIAYWSSSDTLTSDAKFAWQAASARLEITGLPGSVYRYNFLRVLRNDTGAESCRFIVGAGYGSGYDDIFIGRAAGVTGVDSGYGNVSIGAETLQGVTSGYGNTAIGSYAGKVGNNTLNTFVGYNSGTNARGSWNACLGAGAGSVINYGGHNVFVGNDAGGGTGQYAADQNYNTFLGDATTMSAAASYSTIIGSNASCSQSSSCVIGCFTEGSYKLRTGLNIQNPSAYLHVCAGKAAAGFAPIKMTSGVLLTTPEPGALEFDGVHFYGTVGSTRYQFDQQGGGGGTIGVTGGGTGITSATAYSLICAGVTNVDAFQPLASQGTTGQVLTSNGANALPSWQAVAITTTVPTTLGGTGLTAATVYAPLCGGTATDGALQYASSGMGTAGYVLTSNGANALPTWQAGGGGGGSVSGTGVATQLAVWNGVSSLLGDAGLTWTTADSRLTITAAVGSGQKTILKSVHGTAETFRIVVGEYGVSAGRASLYIGQSSGGAVAGEFNTAVGYKTLTATTPGSYNTVVGSDTGYGSGVANSTFIGYHAGYSATGTENTCVGFASGSNLSTGHSNILIGARAGNNGATNSHNIIIGNDANPTATDGLTYSIAIGDSAQFSQSNVCVFGSVTYPVRVGFNMTAPTAKLHLPAGQAAAGNAALKFTSGILLTAAEAGTIEFDGTDFYATKGGTVTRINFTGVHDVVRGGTGIATATAYSVICAGTTATGAFQSLASVGTTGQVLTSNGAGALPSWQAAGGSLIDHDHTATGSGGQITDAALSAAVGIAKGGTGLTATTIHAPLCGGTTTTGAAQQATTGMSNVGYVLTSTGTSSLPTWQAIPGGGGTTDVAHGGTGLTSLTAYSLLCGGTTSTGNVQPLAGVGTTGQVLTSNGPDALPTWQTGSGGGLVDHDHTVTGSGGQITDAALSAAVGVAKGGTGLTTTTTPYGVTCAGTTATGALQVLNSLGTAGQVLTSNGDAALPSWQAGGGGGGGGPIAITSVSANANVAQSDVFISVGSLTAAITLTFPASPAAGEYHDVKDADGAFSTYSVTVNGNGKNIDGAATFVMTANYGSNRFVYNGTKWLVL